METTSIIRHLLCDERSLEEYTRGRHVSAEEIRRRMFLAERNRNREIPDHYYRLLKEKSFRQLDRVGDILRLGLFRLADEYLEIVGERVHVRQRMQSRWQELLTQLPPLVLLGALLHIRRPLDTASRSAVATYYCRTLAPNARYTALPHPYIKQIRQLVREQQGFCDLHIHLNGTTETDVAWQDFLAHPDRIYHDLTTGLRNEMVREEFESELYPCTPEEFHEQLRWAQVLRAYFYRRLCLTEEATVPSHEESPGGDHPFARLLPTEATSLTAELLMYVMLFTELAHTPDERLAAHFHHYLLLLGRSHRLLIQQAHEAGFEQFQKHTLNGLRWHCERTYLARFRQLRGNDLDHVRFIEGRFAPRDTEAGNGALLHEIFEGWEAVLNESSGRSPQLKLIAHFIKQPDTDSTDIRFERLRRRIWNQGWILARMRDKEMRHTKDIVGVDAAASEFSTPPEVFGPTFRMMRRAGFRNFTYHAGEDFFDPVGGLRAICEAIDFLGLEHGDRIGHAVACGISPARWRQHVGEAIPIRRGEHLDNLVFVYGFIIERKIETMQQLLPFLSDTIQHHNYAIYGRYVSTELLVKAWRLRRYCPILMQARTRAAAQELPTFDPDEWNEIRQLLPDAAIPADEILQQHLRYHDLRYRERYDEIIEVRAGTPEQLTNEELVALQLEVLKYMHEREIVIETLPTSYIRIGYHAGFDSYHLINWLRWKQEGHCIPPIVVGTDDAGIFATNIYNEYANIYCLLTHTHAFSHDDAIEILRQFDRNAEVYGFHDA